MRDLGVIFEESKLKRRDTGCISRDVFARTGVHRTMSYPRTSHRGALRRIISRNRASSLPILWILWVWLLLPRGIHHFDYSMSRLAKLIRRGILDLVDRLHSVHVGAQDHDATAKLWSYR